MIRWIR